MAIHPWRGFYPGHLRSRSIHTQQKNREEHTRAMEREAVMRRYEDARRAIGSPVRLTYESGWVIVHTGSGQFRARLSALAFMVGLCEAQAHEAELNATEDT